MEDPPPVDPFEALFDVMAHGRSKVTKNFKFKDFAKCRKNSLKNFLSFKLKDPVGRVGRAR